MNKTHPRKSYIRKKKYLQESSKMLQTAMKSMYSSHGLIISEHQLKLFADSRAREIEASCWFPRLKTSEIDYQNLIISKTRELCQVLISRNLPITALSSAESISLTDPNIQKPPTERFTPNISLSDIKNRNINEHSTIPSHNQPGNCNFIPPFNQTHLANQGSMKNDHKRPTQMTFENKNKNNGILNAELQEACEIKKRNIEPNLLTTEPSHTAMNLFNNDMYGQISFGNSSDDEMRNLF